MTAPESLQSLQPHHQRGIRRTLVLLLVFIAIIVSGFVYSTIKPRPMSDAQLRANDAYLFERPREIGTFALQDDNGQPFTPAQLQGKWSLLFFGFTFCPDICPTTLAQLNQFYGKLEPEYARDTQIILVSVDPARDSAEKLHEYVRYFNPEFRGVTGEFLVLHQLATSLNIPFAKVPGGGDNYQVEHSGNIALVNPKGHYVGFFKAPHDLNKLLQNYKSIRISRD
jgi:protein SCO1